MAELREQLSGVAERVRRRSTGRSERMTIKNQIMKVLLINGSPRKQGNTFLALSEVASALEKQGITTEIVSIGTKAVQGCIACKKCGELGRCVFRDELYDTLHGKLAGADGLGVGSPTYYAAVSYTQLTYGGQYGIYGSSTTKSGNPSDVIAGILIQKGYVIPVSYTHLDVYKRQPRRN